MKALEILKNLQIDVKKDIEAEGVEIFGYIDTAIDEAIAELEEFKNRSCDNCKTKNCSVKRILVEKDEINTEYFNCNDWESK